MAKLGLHPKQTRVLLFVFSFLFNRTDFFKAFQNPPETDLLLVMGTSLTVQPAASFALKIAETTTSIIVNLESTMYDSIFNYSIKENLDVFSKQIWDELKEI